MCYSLDKLESGYGRDIGGGLYLLSVLVAKQKLDGGHRAGCMLILSMILTSEEDFIVQESPGFGGGTTSDI